MAVILQMKFFNADSLGLISDKLTLLQVMNLCLQTISHYMNQCEMVMTKRRPTYIWEGLMNKYQEMFDYGCMILRKRNRNEWIIK